MPDTEKIMKWLKERLRGNEEAEILLNDSENALTRFANNTIHQNVTTRHKGLSLRIIEGKKIGSADTNMLDKKGIDRAIENARIAMEFSPEDPELPSLLEPQNYRPIEGFCDETAAISPQQRADIVKNAIALCDEHKLSAAGILTNSRATLAIANTAGLFAEHSSTSVEFSITVENDDVHGWAGEQGYSIHNISPIDATQKAIQKALDAANPQDIEPGEYTVVLEPDAVSEFLMFLSWVGFGAQGYLDGTSFMRKDMGKKIASEMVTIIDDAYHPMTKGMPFDFEGFPKKKVILVENGVAKGLVHSRRTAKKMGTTSTGHAFPEPNPYGPMPTNMVMETGNSTLEEMIATTPRGLLVTHFHYTNIIEPTKVTFTGMTRDGLFLIEDGEIKNAVKNMRFTESILRALSNVEMVGEKQKLVEGFFSGGFVAPALKIKNFRFTSKTDF